MSVLGFPECEGSNLPREARHAEPDVSALSGAGTSDPRLLQQVREPNSGARTLSDLALELVDGDRQDAYGEPVEHCEKVAGVWRSMFGWDVDGHKFAIAMAALKLVREANLPKKDSRIDTAGWMEIADRIVTNNESAPAPR